ncbi:MULTISPECIES: hypothetical protein [unclassified Candidatus Tisiphia]|uniref:hypothetical protein n=1 Tax=Candidatus Tisiphia endosymbiont of Thecophora atra TaxID=3066258 RepID=UPI00312C95A1
MGNNNIGDEGAKYIAQVLQHNNTVTTIYLDDDNIGDELLKGINKLLKKNKLQATEALKIDQTIDSSFHDHLDSIKCLLKSKDVSSTTKLEMIQEIHQLYNEESLPLLGISEL